jgi:hypothetical protein
VLTGVWFFVYAAMALFGMARDKTRRCTTCGLALDTAVAQGQVGIGAAAVPRSDLVEIPANPQERDPIDKLKDLAALRESGAITQEEFEGQKARLLGD